MSWSAIAGLGSGLFAVAAAALWFWSAYMAMPRATIAFWNNETKRRTPPPIETAMKKQSKISAAAATCAGIAALLQVASAWPTG